MKRNKLFLILALILFCCLSSLTVFSAAADTGQTQFYSLCFEEFIIPEYTEQVRVLAPDNGEVAVEEDGSFIPTKLGRYQIIYPDHSAALTVFKKPYKSTFTLSDSIESEYGRGDGLTLPTALITTELGEVSDYSVSIEFDGRIVKNIDSYKGGYNYIFDKTGRYRIVYYYMDNVGFVATDRHDVTVVDKEILYVNSPETLDVFYGDTYTPSESYGYYLGDKYDVTVSVTSPGGKTEIIEDRYVFSEIGEYSVTYATEINGKSLTKTVQINAVFAYGNTFNPIKDITAITSYAKMPEVQNIGNGRGVEISAMTSGAVVAYNEIIDLSTLGAVDLIRFEPVSSATSKLSAVTINMIDVYDSNNVVSVCFRDAGGENRESYVTVRYGNIDGAIANEPTSAHYKHYREYYGAVAWWTSFRADKWPGSNTFNFRVDYSNKQIWSNFAIDGNYMLLDLDDVNEVGEANAWKGFTTGEIYLTIEFTTVDIMNSSLVISNIAGKELGTAHCEIPEPSDVLSFDYDNTLIENMPEGAVGYGYEIPEPHRQNAVREQFDVDIKVEKDNVDLSDRVDDKIFTPTETGDYTITYTFKDIYGREINKKVYFTVNEKPKEIVIEKVTSPEVLLGKYYPLPEFEVTGGAGGAIDVQRKIYYNDQPIEPDLANKIFLDEVGQIKIVLTATDCIGYSKSEEFYVDITMAEPLLIVNGVPISVREGETVVFPDFTALDLTFEEGEAGYEMSKSVTVDGERLSDDLTYVVPSGKTSLTVRYIAGENTEKEVYREFTVAVLNPTELSDYFIAEYGTFNSSVEENGTHFDITGAGKLTYAEPLVAEGVLFKFGLNTTASYMDFVFEDYENSDIKIFIRLKSAINAAGETVCNALINGRGTEYTIVGSMSDLTKHISLMIGNLKKQFQNESGGRITDLIYCENGDVFTGFTSGLVRMSVIIPDGTTELLVTNVSNQVFYSDAYAFGDVQGPVIKYNEPIKDCSLIPGSKFNIPAAEAYDVLQGKGSVTVSLTCNGKSIFSNQSITESKTIDIDKIGFYVVTYTALDAMANTTIATYTVRCLDTVTPTVTVDGTVKTSYKVGEKLKVPNITVSDNYYSESDIIVLIYIEYDLNKVLLKEGDEYVLEREGKYKLVYWVADKEYNVNRTVFEITVER